MTKGNRNAITQKELLEHAKKVDWLKLDEVPILSGIYIIQQRYLHDSGYRLMYVIGHTEDFEYYLLDEVADVVDFETFWTHIPLDAMHIDINRNGIIHLWSGRTKFKCTHAISNCALETIGGGKNE